MERHRDDINRSVISDWNGHLESHIRFLCTGNRRSLPDACACFNKLIDRWNNPRSKKIGFFENRNVYIKIGVADGSYLL